MRREAGCARSCHSLSKCGWKTPGSLASIGSPGARRHIQTVRAGALDTAHPSAAGGSAGRPVSLRPRLRARAPLEHASSGCGRQEVAAELAGGNQPPRSSPAEAGGCGVCSRRRVVDAVDRRGECPPLPETCHLRSPSLAPDPLRLLRTATGLLRTICRASALSRAHNRRLAWLRAFLAG